MKNILLCIIGCLFCYNGIVHSQDSILNHWETVIFPGDTMKYFPGTITPGANWKDISFNDNSWSSGPGGIGFGDNDDSTIISSVLSVFIRKDFNISDLTKISYGILHIDYDDAFVAYLNGSEIARSNIGTVGDSPAFNQPAIGNHEAKMYTGGMPEEYFITDDILLSLLQQGENVLSVQVHNVNITSTDLSSIIFLSLGITDASVFYRPTPAWFTSPIIPDEPFVSSNLPIIVINTAGNAGIPNEPKIIADMGIIYNANGQRNYITDEFNEYSGKIGIEIRGNATQSFPKKSFGLETIDNLGVNLNVPLFGLSPENDWILNAHYIDKTLMRNFLASTMSQEMGHYASHIIFCELVLNGNYEGVYSFMEKIKWDDGRLNIDKLYPWTTDEDSITGGYIFEVAQAGVDFGERRRFKYPGPDEISPVQTNYIKNYDDNFRTTMLQYNYANPLTGYPMLIDVNSFIDEIIVQEACKNSDAYGWSSYFYKDRLKKLSAGPIWDFDQALANSTFNEGDRTDEWLFNKGYTDVPAFWAKLFNEPNFKYLFKKRWLELRANELHTDSLIKVIDTTAIYLNESQQRNYIRWPILGTELWRSLPGWDTRDTYQKEVDYMKDWLINHLQWIDTQLASVPDRVIKIPELVISEIMYSPYNGNNYEFIEIANVSDNDILLTGVFFADGITYTFPVGEKISKGGFKVIAANTARFESRYGFSPSGEFYGQLDNAGEKISLQTSLGVEIDAVRFNDKAPWPVMDTTNPGSIELIDLVSDNSLPQHWALSANYLGTPMAGYGQTSIDNVISSAEITIFPNPITDLMNIVLPGLLKGDVQVDIYDLLGSVQFSKHYPNLTDQYLSVNLKDINNGHYIVRLTTQNSIISKHILISR